MSSNKLTDDKILDVAQALESAPNVTEAARMLNIPRTTFISRMQAGIERGIIRSKEVNTETYSIDIEPDDDQNIEDIVETLTDRFKKRKNYIESKNWRQIRMKSNEPIGLLWLGDPHVDDNYCDWEKLRSHIDIIQSNDGIYGCGLGDYQNNWVGRLSRLYSEQDTSHSTAWKLVEWLINNINPLILIGGNHDMWSGSGDPLKWMTQSHTIREDWEAKVEITFPNGESCKIHAAHDMPGHSQWNPLHAQTKMAMFKSNAHLYISGHKHIWALAQIELTEQKSSAWLARARGYKYYDTFALTKGYDQQHFGQAILQVINPLAQNPTGFVHCFADVETGAEYLKFLRSSSQSA